MKTLKELIESALEESLRHTDPVSCLRDAVEEIILNGYTKKAVLSELEALRKDVAEDEEDIILDVMDFLVGWCSVFMRI